MNGNNFINNSNNYSISNKLKVGVITNAYPFTFCRDDGKKKGLLIEIWEKIARKNQLDFEYICIDPKLTYDKIIEDIYENKYDLVLGDFSVNYKRWQKILFSRPYFVARIDVSRKVNSGITKIISNKWIILLISLCFFLIIVYSIIYMKINKSSFSNAFYNNFINFFTNMKEVLIKDRSSANIKFLNVFWSIMRYLFYAMITAQIIRILVDPEDFITKKEFESIKEINVMEGTSFIDMVKSLGKTPIINKSYEEIINKLKNSNGNVYWLSDKYTQNRINIKYDYELKLTTTKNTIFLDENAIAINKKHSDLLHKINNTLTELQDDYSINSICSTYFNNLTDILSCRL